MSGAGAAVPHAPSRDRGPGRSARARGQATVEFALGLPVIVIGALLVLQFALVAGDHLRVVHAAREAARAAAVGSPSADITSAALSSSALDQHRTRVTVRRSGPRVSVTVRYAARTDVPLIGALLPDPTLTASTTMRNEPVPPR